MPIEIEQFELNGYDLVISSNHAVAKGVITGPDQVHVCYDHSPTRYAWDLQAQYLRQSGVDRGLKSLYARWLLHRLRSWDVRSSAGVHVFVANSSYIAKRIRKAYRRDPTIVHPPVNVDRFTPGAGPGAVYLVASRFVPDKRIDLIAEAFAVMPDCPLLIIGDGPEQERVQRAASWAAKITIRPPVDQVTLVQLMQQARAFVYAAEEDFGITMVEAQACGTPLIAFGRGGACNIIDADEPDLSTGVLFPEQTRDAIVAAVCSFEARSSPIAPDASRANALRFCEAAFVERFKAVIGDALASAKRSRRSSGVSGIYHREGAWPDAEPPSRRVISAR